MPLYSRTSLGKVRWPLKSLISCFNQHVPVSVDLVYKGSKGEVQQGQVHMRGIIVKALKTPALVASKAAEAPPATAQPSTAPTHVPAVVSKPGVTHFLFISSISAKGLKNVELTPGDKNDPYVTLNFGGNKWKFKTEVRVEAGSEARWQYERADPEAQEVRFPVTEEELASGAISVVVTDKNQFFGDKLIGKGKAKLPHSLVPTKEATESEIVCGELCVPVADQGVISGSVTLVIERETLVEGSVLRKPAPAPAAPVIASSATAAAPTTETIDFSQYKHSLFISKIVGKALRNVEKMWMDKNDPYVIMKFGKNTWTYKTSVIEEGGAEPVWEYDVRQDPQMKFSVDLDELRVPTAGLLRLTVMDKNKLLKDALIGEGEIAVASVPALCPRAAVEEKVQTEVTVELAGGAGAVVLTIERETALKSKKPSTVEELNKGKEAATSSAGVVKSFEVGQLLVTKVVCQDLANVETWGGKNDPYVKIQLGPEERQTEVIEEGGANVCFDYLNFSFDVDRGLVEFEPLNVTVTDHNSMNAHKLIGTASSSIRFMLQKVDEGPIQLPLPLKNEKGKVTGAVILFLTLKPAELLPVSDAPLDPAFQSGLLHINRVRAFDLQKPKSLLDKGHVSDPYVKMSFGTWQYKTNPLSVAAAGSPIFDDLDLSADVTVAMLQTVKLCVEVYDKGMISDTLVGKGECSMRSTAVKVGEEVQVSVDLVNNGATAGKLLIFAHAAQKKTKLKKGDITVDESFEQGYCSIKSITAHNLKNTEIGPFGKQVLAC